MPAVMAALLCWMLTSPAWALDDRSVEVLAAQSARFAALETHTLEALASLLADELLYTHTTAAVETKHDFLDNLVKGRFRYHHIEAQDRVVQVHGEMALITGRVSLEVILGDQPLTVIARFTEVQVYRDGRWQLLAWQSTRVPN